MRFWDTSALVPLVLKESTTEDMALLLAADPDILVSVFTSVELASTIWRKARLAQATLTRKDVETLTDFLEAVSKKVENTDAVSSHAREVLSRHPLRAADAVQLASAMTARGDARFSLPFVTLDTRLAAAARAEGFPVLP